jgi:ribosome recycling factor
LIITKAATLRKLFVEKRLARWFLKRFKEDDSVSYEQMIRAGEEPMKKVTERVQAEFSAMRTGRANVALLSNVKVESYGTLMALNQVAGVSVPDGRTIEIRPWDVSQLPAIEKSLQKADLGMTPVNDGKIIRLSVPMMTEDRRKDMVKNVHKMAEEFRISVRNERRKINDEIKKAEKDKLLTEDERKKGEQELNKLTDSYIHKIDEIVKLKEKDIMEV